MAKQNRGEIDQRLLDQWVPPEGAGDPVGCIATTFTFAPDFFEEHCLSRFLRMETDPREDGAAYLIEREEKLAVSRVFVLVDRIHADGSASPRWDVLTVRPPAGIFHAKIAVLVWHGWIRLIIGSANLTEPGYRKNQEVFGVLDFHDGGNVPRRGLTECLDFVNDILPFCPGSSTEAGPKSRLIQFLQNIRASSARWKIEPFGFSESAQVEPVFVAPIRGYNGSVLRRLGQLIRDHGGPAHEACVLSPFFDVSEDSGAYLVTEELLGALADRGSREIDYMVRCEELPDGRIRLQAPKSLVTKGKKLAGYYVWPVKEAIDGEFRPLHAKSIWLWNDTWHVYMIGSSNFTSAGLGLAKSASNFEANLAYVFRSEKKFEDIMDKTLPPYGDRLIDFDAVIWQAVDERTGEYAITAATLPPGFEEALFELEGDSAVLRFRFGTNLPQEWAVSFKGVSAVFSATEWRQLNSPPIAEVAWVEQAIPNVLEVVWFDNTQQKQTARWPVNVTDPTQLPPPDALRNLSLQTLLEILCSGRPLHEAVGGSRTSGNRASVNSDMEDELDPLKRISSETFLLQRTRRVAKAIDQLVQALSRPVVHHDALAWRLRGPVGPCALAKAICRESRTPGEACFLLSEIVLVLRRIDTSKIAIGVKQSEVDTALGEIVAEIRSMVAEQLNYGDVPPAMSEYISAALQEI